MKTIIEQFNSILRTPSFKMFLNVAGEESYHEFDIYEENGSFIIDFDVNYYSQLKVEIKPYLTLKEHLQLLYDKLTDKIIETEAEVCEYSDVIKDICFAA